ncbi:hypothetical protein Tco_0355020 [Tanacetum coccineum]
MTCCGQFITRIAKKMSLLTDEVLDGQSAPIYCRLLDATTLRELIGSNRRLIIKDPTPGVPKVTMPRPPRPTMQDLYDRMGRIEIRQGTLKGRSHRQSYHSDSKPVEKTTHVSLASGFIPGSSSDVKELLQTVRAFHACKQEEGQSVSSYILKMERYIDNLERLDHPVSLNLAVSLILISMSKEYDGFVQNYNMHGMEKIVNELHAMLKLHEQMLLKKDATPVVMAIKA